MGHAAILGALLFDAPPFGQDQDWEKSRWREKVAFFSWSFGVGRAAGSDPR
jgi:hypothetical protein